jgi:hypothetical protein
MSGIWPSVSVERGLDRWQNVQYKHAGGRVVAGGTWRVRADSVAVASVDAVRSAISA